jgi:Fe-S cluster biogenesis protein NfuA
MPGLDQLLDELERLLTEAEMLEEPVRGHVFGLLDGVDALHRHALARLADALGPEQLERLRAADPAVAWLCDAYAMGVDERAAAEAALEAVRPYLHSHGGDVAVLDAQAGVVRVRLSGACAGCTASTITLRRGVEEALREGLPGFAVMEVQDDDGAPAHPPPGPTLLQIEAYAPASAPTEPAPPGSELLQIELPAPRRSDG